jgi:ubiquinone/menaquinone biosynthesis C-methylase UbiE
MQTPTETFQLSVAAAEAYEARFVPALFAPWAAHLVAFADIAPGRAVLDVACGTGIVARTAADRAGTAGRVVGLDLNEAMLAVARRVRGDLEWRRGDASALPLPDASFDVVLCQMALMFFPDRAGALREMGRVVRPGGLVAVLVPGRLPSQPAYAPFVEAAARHAGPEALSLLGAYFACGDLDELTRVIASAGLRVVRTATRVGTTTFPSVAEFVATEVESTPLVERIGEDVYDRIREDAREVLRPFTRPTGAVEIPLECHLVAARPAGERGAVDTPVPASLA